MATPLSVAVLGVGAFGRNHLRIYRELEAAGLVRLVAIADASRQGIAEAALSASTQVFPSAGALAAAVKNGSLQLDAASICLPTRFHAEAAIALMEAGVHVLVEKPLADSLDQAEAILRCASAHHRILQVGHLERFNPAVQEVLKHTSRPMFFEVHRLSIFTPRSLDVDVVLDLMIHDLDIVLQLANSSVAEIRAVGLPVLSQKTDIANVRLEFASGCVANFTASRVSTERVRKLRFFQPHQYISLDYAKQEAFQIDVQPGADFSTDAGTLSGLSFRPYSIEKSEPLRVEIESFLHSVRTGRPPVVTGEQARNALDLALQITGQIAEHRRRAGL